MSKMSDIRNPYSGEVVGQVPMHSADDVRQAIAKAQAVAPKLAGMTTYRRGAILNRIASLIDDQANDIATLMAQESAKPMKYARGEVNRAVETFTFAADEARRIHGETVPMDAAKGGAGKIGYYMRVPVGIVAAITPFNFPLNLVAHKVAPAIAVGNPIVLKPNPLTPLTALRLQQIVAEAGLPDGGFEVVLGDAEVGEALTTDPRIAMISFTGSPPVADAISKVAGIKRTLFELGGNAATIIAQDADLGKAVATLCGGSLRLQWSSVHQCAKYLHA
jgi:acyl-CoA reductase-like NAD-dependent aldehyde dehydrogenase